MDSCDQIVQPLSQALPHFHVELARSQGASKGPIVGPGLSSWTILLDRLQAQFVVLLIKDCQILPWRNRQLQARRVFTLFKIRNYAPTLRDSHEANKRNYQQILWLYGEDEQVVEVGASNIFFVFKTANSNVKEIVTPDLEDLVLPGVTRDSILVHFGVTFSN